MTNYHVPIMLKEIVEGLNLQPSSIVLDCTLGGAGHSSEIIKHIPNGKLIGIDKDNDALKFSSERLKNYKNIIIAKSDFKDFEKVLDENGIEKVDGILIDLGVSSHQIDTAERGFSFRFDGPLDMRMNTNQDFSAYDVVNFYSKERLISILRTYGEERFAPQIVTAIVNARKISPIKTTKQLNEIIENCLPKKIVYKSGGAAKKTFQAIRIEVNGELENLPETLNKMINRLNVGGRIAVLSFHSLEDRIVKNVFRLNATDCLCPPSAPICICGHKASVKLINRSPIVATAEENSENPRSTSAKLRIAEKI